LFADYPPILILSPSLNTRRVLAASFNFPADHTADFFPPQEEREISDAIHISFLASPTPILPPNFDESSAKDPAKTDPAQWQTTTMDNDTVTPAPPAGGNFRFGIFNSRFRFSCSLKLTDFFL
jgi:hypothetical protein